MGEHQLVALAVAGDLGIDLLGPRTIVVAGAPHHLGPERRQPPVADATQWVDGQPPVQSLGVGESEVEQEVATPRMPDHVRPVPTEVVEHPDRVVRLLRHT